MKILTTFLIVMFSISCNTKNVSSIVLQVDNNKKEKAHLAKLKFTDAILVYGEPKVSNKLKVEEISLSTEQLIAVNKYFPNKEYEFKKVFFLEAQWKRPIKTDLMVWYLFIDNEWKPIEVHAKA